MGSGFLRFEIRTANGDLPVASANIRVDNDKGVTINELTSDESGQTKQIELEAPDQGGTFDPKYEGEPYAKYNITVTARGFRPVEVFGVQVFDTQSSYLPVIMHPMTQTGRSSSADRYDIGKNALQMPQQSGPADQEFERPNGRVLREVIIPDYITVKLGTPTSNARTERVPFIYYIKNVASSEIWPDWPPASLEANILCQISLALNRIYTEWYPNRGYNFNITASTTVDQYYVSGRNIHDSVIPIVDRIFNNYLKRQGFKEPFYAEYCDGEKKDCPGLKQWGTVYLANLGYTPIEIIHYYYPKDIEIVESNRFGGIYDSYPGYSLRMGSYGEYVQTMQIYLNRISTDYPSIPKIQNPDGVFGAQTEAAVKAFQRISNIITGVYLAPDGIIGKSTWVQISRAYVAIKRLAQLTSEGERLGIGKTPPTTTVRLGEKGENIVLLQFLLNFVSEYYSSVPPVLQTGIFDTATRDSVIAFQKEYGLTADGVVGSATWRALYDVYNGIVENSPTPPSGIEDYPGSPLNTGSSGESVKLIQNYLNALSQVFPSIPKLTADGKYGPATKQAVMEYQRLFGLTVDGIVGPSTWKSIVDQHNLLHLDVYPGTALRVGSQGSDVQRIQHYLNAIRASYPSIPRLTEDGKFGSGTAGAVKEFQRIFGLSQDGVVGKNTWDAIIQQYRMTQLIPSSARASSPEESSPIPYENNLYPGQPIKFGASGQNVEFIQKYLTALASSYRHIPKLEINSNFDAATEDAVKAFQRLFNLPDDGIIGPQTWKAMVDAYWNLNNREAMISAMGRMLVSKMIFK